MHLRTFSILLLALSFGLFANGEPQSITLAGSSTLTRVLLPLKPGVEAAYGVEIRLIPVGSGRGLAELAENRVDAAMLSGPVGYLVEKLRERSGCSLRVEQLEQLRLPHNHKAEVVALLHPALPIRSLSREQLRAVLAGEIANWSALGGPDLAITVVLPDELDGVRATVDTELMEGRAFSPKAQIVPRIPDTIPVVLATPGAVGVLPRASLPAAAISAEITPTLFVTLYIVAFNARMEDDPRTGMVLNSLHSRAR